MEFRCVYCQLIIPNIRIKCNICSEYELCLECFSSGAESGGHKADHDYQTLDDGFRSLFTTSDSREWTATQELSLIEGIDHYGLGNWEAVSCQVRNKSVLDVKSHFDKHYIAGAIGCETRLKKRQYEVTDHTGPVDGPLSPSLTMPLPPLNLTKAEAMELGFLPLRDDFEREWDNEAEGVLSGAVIHHADEEVDMAYKLSLVSMYRLRLRERNLRKKVARDYSLVNVYTSSFKKGHSSSKKRLTRDYKDFQEKMKKFAQFLTLQEHDRFFHSLQREKQLKSRIKELLKLRRNGISKLDDADQYERDCARREKTKELLKKEKNSRLAGNVSNNARRSETPPPRRSNNSMNLRLANSSLASVPSPEKGRNGCIGKSLDGVNGILTVKPPLEQKADAPTEHSTQMLSDTEKKLCKRIGMKTSSYVTLKTCILKDYVKRQHGAPVKLRYPSGYDKTHRRTILNFLEHSGWIQLEN